MSQYIIVKGVKVTPPDVIQACKAVFLASSADDCETTINGVEVLKRRYPDIFKNYKKLGADIQGPFEISEDIK